MKTDNELYQRWIEQRRAERPGPELTDRVMMALTRASISQPPSRPGLLLMWIDCSRLRRLAACVGAFLVGSMPFVYVACISQAIVF